MGSCYLCDYTGEGYKYTDITTCNIEEPQQKYRLGTVSNSNNEGGTSTCSLSPLGSLGSF